MFKRFSQISVSVVVAIGLLVALPVAINGRWVLAQDDQTERDDQTAQTVTEAEDTTEAEDSTEESESVNDKIRGEWEHGRQGGISDMAWRRVCQLRQRAVDHRVGVIRGVMRRHIDFMDRLFVRVQTLVTEQNLAVADYEGLVNDVKAAQAAVKNSTDGVSAEPPKLDCEDDDSRDEVEGFRSELHQLVTNLRNYRDGLKNFVQAVREAWTNRAVDQ